MKRSNYAVNLRKIIRIWISPRGFQRIGNQKQRNEWNISSIYFLGKITIAAGKICWEEHNALKLR